MDEDIVSLTLGAPSSVPKARSADYSGMIDAAEKKYGIPTGLLHAVITKGERSGAVAVSPRGAVGLGQLMPGTAKEMGVTDPTDPAQNIDGSGKYFGQLYAKYKDPKLAVAAYNAGPGAVDKHGGVPPFPETQAYVARVTGDAGQAAPAQDSGDIVSLTLGRNAPYAAPIQSPPAHAQANAATPSAQPRTFTGDLQSVIPNATAAANKLPPWMPDEAKGLVWGANVLNGGVNAVGGAIGSGWHALTGGRSLTGKGNAPIEVKTVGGKRFYRWNGEGAFKPGPDFRKPDGSEDWAKNNAALEADRPNISERVTQDTLGNATAQLATFAVPGGAGGNKLVSAEPKMAGGMTQIANKLMGGRLLDPAAQARALLLSDLTKDGATPAAAVKILNEWQASGASAPSLADVASKLPNGGQNVLARLRGAAVANPTARGVVSAYRHGIEANLQDNAQNLARGLHPDPRSTPQFVSDAEAARRKSAETTYAAPYATPVDLNKPALSALSDAPGNAALLQSRAAAVANRRWDQVADINKLLGAQDENFNWSFRDQGAAPISDKGRTPFRAGSTPGMRRSTTGDPILQSGPNNAYTGPSAPLPDVPQVSGGTLDRARIALREAGNAAKKAGNNDVAAGLFERMNDLDSALDSAPGLQDARADFGNRSAAIKAADHGENILVQVPQDYMAGYGAITKGLRAVGPAPAAAAENDVQAALQLGARNKLIGDIGRPAEGAQGLLNRLSGSNNIGENLTTTFGDAAGPFRQGIGNEASRVQTARAIDPLYGSKTAVNNEDSAAQSLVEGALDLKKTLIRGALRKLSEGLTLTDAERKAIVEMGVGRLNAADLAPRNKLIKYDPNVLPFANSSAVSQPRLVASLPPTAAAQPAQTKRKNR